MEKKFRSSKFFPGLILEIIDNSIFIFKYKNIRIEYLIKNGYFEEVLRIKKFPKKIEKHIQNTVERYAQKSKIKVSS